MVSKKYEIDENYWRVEANHSLTPEQKTDELDKKGKQMKHKAFSFSFIALTTTVLATGMLIKRRKIIER